MKKFIVLLLLLMPFYPLKSQDIADQYTIELARMFSEDLFKTNGVPYLQPVVKVVNATSNARFFNAAYVPKQVEKPYFKVSLNGMMGLVPEDMKTYNPVLPTEEFVMDSLYNYGTVSFFPEPSISIQDTAGLIHYIFLNLMYDGLYGTDPAMINVPEEAATALGNQKSYFDLPNGVLDSLIKRHPLYALMQEYAPEILGDVTGAIEQFPERFNLAEGSNLNTIAAGVPQIEVGSYYGTEALIRFIPPVDLGETIGEFSFYGFGLKHSISQYFPERYFDLAVQAVWQSTHLENYVGVTQAKLIADANMWNFNIHGSKSFENIIDVYTGLSIEMIDIESSYKYYLPVEIQWQLGLLEKPSYEPTPGYPGDQNPQTTEIGLTDTNIKWTIGLAREIGPVAIYVDYSISKFNIFTGGILYKFSI